MAISFAVGLVLTTVFLGAAAASAHAVLVSSDPGYGAMVDHAPTRVSITFDEAVTVAPNAVTVTDRDGTRADDGTTTTTDGGRTVVVPLRSGLPDNTYLLGWSLLSADGHVVAGSIVFGIGVPPDLTVTTAPPDPLIAALDVIVRLLTALGYLGIALAVGIPLAVRLVWPEAGSTRAITQFIRIGATTTVVTALATFALIPGRLAGAGGWGEPHTWIQSVTSLVGATLLAKAAGATALARAATRSAGPIATGHANEPPDLVNSEHGPVVPARTMLAGMLDDSAIVDGKAAESGASDTRFDQAPNDSTAMVEERVVDVAAARVGASERLYRSLAQRFRAAVRGHRGRGDGRARRAGSIMVVAGTVVVLAQAASGHAVAGEYRWAAVISTVLHVIAMAVWVGGLVAVGVAWRTSWRGEVVVRFGPVAAAAVGVLVISGVFQAWRAVSPVAALWSTSWGRLLLVKLVLVAVAAAAATVVRRGGHSRGVAASRRPRAKPARVTSPSNWALRVEIGAQVAVLTVTALLTGVAPARDTYDPAVALDVPVGALTAHVDVDGTHVGRQEITVRLRDSAGVPTGALEVTGRLERAAGGVGPVEVVFRRVEPVEIGPDYFVSRAVRVPVAGEWRLRLTVVADRVRGYAATVSYRVW